MISSSTALNIISSGLKDTGGAFSLSYFSTQAQWVCTVRRSPSNADAVIAISKESAADAVEKALNQAGWLDQYDNQGNIKESTSEPR